MNIFIAGATGVLGRRLVRQLSAHGHDVVALVRSRENERVVSELGGQPRYADMFDADNLVHAMKGCDVVIHAATAIPTKQRTTDEDWKLNDRIRREGTEALARSAGQVGAKTFIFQSIVWLANPADGSKFDEQSHPCPVSLMQSALDGEGIAQEMGALHGFSAVVLRCGWFYAADATHTRMFAAGLARRRLPIVGRGDNYLHCLHADDAASAFVAATERGQSGLWHVVDDEPVRMCDFLKRLAEKLSAPPPRRVPIWLARLLAGQGAVDFMTQSTRTSNARLRQDFDWQPRYPTYREGIDEIVAQWGGRAPA